MEEVKINILVILGLIGFIIVQQVYFLHVIGKLINKLMSRNYYDYRLSEEVSTDKIVSASDGLQEVPIDPLLQQELDSISNLV